MSPLDRTALAPARHDGPGEHALRPLFQPASVAVVGASARPDKAGHAMAQALLGFGGDLHLVNPRGGEILGRTAVPSLRDVPGTELAVLVVPPHVVPAALADAGAAGVRAAVVCAGGFAESGPEGARLQAEVAAVAQEAGIRLLGPNTSGFVNPVDGATATFLPAVAELLPGSVGVVAQSGGVNLAVAFLLARAGVGLRLGAGLGNAVDVGFVDVLDFLAADDATTAVGLHVEGVADGAALVEAVRRTSARKPVVAFCVGRSDVADFARSHTGAMAGSWAVTRAALRQAGAVVVDGLDDLVAALTALSRVRLPATADPGVGVLTGQAGPGLVVADALGSRGVRVPPLAEASRARLAELLPPLTYQANPVDTGRPDATFPDVLATVAGDPGVDVVGVYALDEPGVLDPKAAVAPAVGRVLWATGGPEATVARRRRELDRVGVPLLPSPGALATALVAVVEDARGRAVPDAPPRPPVRRVGGALDEDGAKRLVEAAGLRTPRRWVAADHAQAHAALDAAAGPVAVKVLDAAVAHKSDVGGVHLGVRDHAALDRALAAVDAVPGASVQRRYLVEEMAPPGTDVIVGGVRDRAFGPLVLLGLGGVAAELAGPPVLRLAPLSPERAREMVDALPPAVLDGFRGAPPVPRAVLADVLVRVGDLLVDHADVAEVDLNPVRLTADGALVLDALVVTDVTTDTEE